MRHRFQQWDTLLASFVMLRPSHDVGGVKQQGQAAECGLRYCAVVKRANIEAGEVTGELASDAVERVP